MADVLPSEYDAIILGTGLPEAVVAAALSRVGYKVLHLDRNDYYSGYWASFSFENLQEWIKRNISSEVESVKSCAEKLASDGEAVKTHEKHFCLPLHGNAITNIEVRSFLRTAVSLDKDTDNDSEETVKETIETSEDAIVSAEVKPDVETSVREEHEPLAPVPQCQTSGTTTEKNEETSESTQSCDDPEIPASTPKDEAEHSGVSNVLSWAEKRKMKKDIKLGRDATYEELLQQSRKFNLDLSPKLLFCRGSLVDSLISANIAHYAEFKVVSRILTYMNGKIEEVPCSRSDVFNSELINVLEKRALMRFITFCANFEESPEQYLDFQDKPFIDFLKCRKLTSNLQHIITHAIAVVAENTTTLCGLNATQKFLQSLGRYGNTPFLWSLYGSGELPQAFCRMCAVFGGIYCLRKNVNCLVFDEGCKKCLGVISEDGQRLTTKWLIMEKSYAPEIFEMETQCMISRAILITDKSLKPSSREHVTFLTLSSNSSGLPVRVIELGPSSMACPQSLYVVHVIAETFSTALEDLEVYVKQLFTTADEEDSPDGKPAVLWSVYFNRKCFVPKESDVVPENVKLTSLPSSQLDFEDAMKEAKAIFTSICPDEEFLQAVPNPEDIIWDDILNNPDTKQEPVTDESISASGEHVDETTTTGHDATNGGDSKEHDVASSAIDSTRNQAKHSDETITAEHSDVSEIQSDRILLPKLKMLSEKDIII